MKCSDLKQGRLVIFKLYSDIFKKKIPWDGNVIYVEPERKRVCVCYLDGYKSETEDIPYEDMLAAYDENGEMMTFDNIKVKSVLLIPE